MVYPTQVGNGYHELQADKFGFRPIRSGEVKKLHLIPDCGVKYLGYDGPVYVYDNGKKIESACNSAKGKAHVKQSFENKENMQVKRTTVGANSTVEILDSESGNYSVVRKNNAGEVVLGYEMNLKPQGRKFAHGLAGKIQKMALKSASIGGGQERPVLSQVVELMFNVAKKIR